MYFTKNEKVPQSIFNLYARSAVRIIETKPRTRYVFNSRLLANTFENYRFDDLRRPVLAHTRMFDFMRTNAGLMHTFTNSVRRTKKLFDSSYTSESVVSTLQDVTGLYTSF